MTMMAASSAAARKRTAALVNLAMVVEQANEQMLPAVYLFVGTSLSATPSQLGALTLCRALVQTLSSPLSGVLGDRSDRRLVLAAGAFIWGVMTSAIALSTRLRVAMFFAAVNGLGLALLVPCCQSLVADLHPPEHRGRAFGLMQLTGALGGMAGSVFATNVGAADTVATWGVEGWRLAFHAVAGLSVLMGIAVLMLAVDPRRAPGMAVHGAYDPLAAAEPSADTTTGTAAAAAAAVAAAGGSSADQQQLPMSYHLSRSKHDAASSGMPRSRSPLLGVHDVAQSPPLPPPPHQQQQADLRHLHHQALVLHDAEVPGRDDEACGGGGGSGSSSSAWADKPRFRPRPRRRGLLADVGWVLRIPTFQAIVLQGIVGCFPWQAAVFMTLWLQLQGFPAAVASVVTATFGAGVAGGALLGGYVGDRMARRLPDSGRIFTAQASVASGIPLTWLLLKGVPATPWLASDPRAYAAVLFILGLTCSWAGAGCNSPIFAEIVPEDMRSLIYAFDRSLESSLAACAAPAVGLLAERVFGFSGAVNTQSMSDVDLRTRNANALGSSLLACMVLPWSACLAFYTVLHFTYRHDRRAALAAAASS